jgi:hypothetical protein
MATAYRVQAYLKHHHDRETYQRHRKASEQMIARWRAAGSPDNAEVAAWFQNARQTAIAGQAPPLALDLPPVPTEQLVEANPQPETKPLPARTRPASMTKQVPSDEEEAATDEALPSPIVPPDAYQDEEKSSEPIEGKSNEAEAPTSTGTETETDFELDEAGFQESRSGLSIVRSTVKALLRAVLRERD